MISPLAPLRRLLPTMLFCLALTGAADAAASTGPVVGWGDDSYGRATPPNAVNGVSGIATDFAAGTSHSCAIQAGTGIVVCWGLNSSGQATPPDAVNGVSGTATDIAVGGGLHSCAIQAGTGHVVCWGSDSYGQATPPNAVNGVSGTAADISAGASDTFAIVPEPSALTALASGIVMLAFVYRRRRHSSVQ